MKAQFVAKLVIGAGSLLVTLGTTQAQIHVDSARIGCLDIQKDGNLTGLVGNACNGKTSCSYKAPTEAQYRSAGVVARTRTFCTQGMEIIYHCGNEPAKSIDVRGDAWNQAPAVLVCAASSAILRPEPAAGVLTPASAPPLYIVTLGDSVMWGQGLPENNKFRNIVTQWIQNQYQGTRKVIQIPTRAHSGARIVADQPEQAGMPGEIPRQWPSITQQVELTKGDLLSQGITPDQVNLVLLDGCINDVNITNIMNPTKHINDLHNLVISNCGLRMHDLLLKVRAAFPSAAIIVTGYFPIASGESDMAALLAFSSGVVAGVPMFAANNIVGTASSLAVSVNAALVGVAAGPEIKDRLVSLSAEFNNTAQAGFAADIQQFIQNDPQHNKMNVPGFRGAPVSIPRVALVWPNFSKWNSYAAPETFLFNLGQFLKDEARGVTGTHPEAQTTLNQVAYTRAQTCIAEHQDDGFCLDASMGHPNIAGDQAYADPIIGLLQEFPEWVGLKKLSVSVNPETVQPNVLTNMVVQVTDFVTQQPVPGAVIQVGKLTVHPGQSFQHRVTCFAPPSNPRATGNNTNNRAISEPPDFPPPGFAVSAPGYLSTNVELEVAGVRTGSRLCK